MMKAAHYQYRNAFLLAVTIGVMLVSRLVRQVHENVEHNVISNIGIGKGPTTMANPNDALREHKRHIKHSEEIGYTSRDYERPHP
jgi:hypothetical protein